MDKEGSIRRLRQSVQRVAAEAARLEQMVQRLQKERRQLRNALVRRQQCSIPSIPFLGDVR